jgi:hypothetical protein
MTKERPGGSSPGHSAVNLLQNLGDYPGHSSLSSLLPPAASSPNISKIQEKGKLGAK